MCEGYVGFGATRNGETNGQQHGKSRVGYYQRPFEVYLGHPLPRFYIESLC